MVPGSWSLNSSKATKNSLWQMCLILMFVDIIPSLVGISTAATYTCIRMMALTNAGPFWYWSGMFLQILHCHSMYTWSEVQNRRDDRPDEISRPVKIYYPIIFMLYEKQFLITERVKNHKNVSVKIHGFNAIGKRTYANYACLNFAARSVPKV